MNMEARTISIDGMSPEEYRASLAPQPGDWADHLSGRLDPRLISRVKRCGRGYQIWIQIGNTEAGPLRASNYLITRAVHAD